MNIRHYENNGWRPTVLAVDPKLAGRRIEPVLSRTVPADIEVVRSGGFSKALSATLGVSDVSLRSMWSMASVGDDLIAQKKIDAVFFSTTAFLSMQLGIRWLRRFGTPFVLDMQDPWFAAPPATIPLRRHGLKHHLMRRLHARAEAATMPHASGLMAVSEAYIEALTDAYPELRKKPSEVIPFGYSKADFELAREVGTPWQPTGLRAPFAIYAGRVAPSMTGGLDTLFAAIALARSEGIAPLSELAVGFVGTGYQQYGNPPVVSDAAKQAGLGPHVIEHADRISLFDSLASLQAADVLLLFGSHDIAYQPSKLFQLLAIRKPVICLAPSDSRLAKQVRALRSVVLFETNRSLEKTTVRAAGERLSALLSASPCADVYKERDEICTANDSATLAARECALFDRAVAQARC
ncbi:hypothetical protein KUV46_12060 [Thalassovita mediterranea]|nr:hypothetical protein KUV46_12060 [Thalassovita mediterranea]